MMPEVVVKNLSDILYKTLSIRVPCCSENLVGNVIFGKKLSVYFLFSVNLCCSLLL